MMDMCPPRPRRRPPRRAPRPKQKPGELFLIDGNSLAYRAFFALPESIATHDGRPTNAIYGLASMFAKMLIDHDPAAVVVCWDAGWSGRELTYEPYKSQRKPRPDLLRDQWPHLMPLAEAFGFTNIRVDGYEADDVIASLTKRAREQDLAVMVVSGDRDVYQLVEDGVRVMTTSRGVTDTKIYDSDGVVERYGVPPELVTDLIGLKGDTSDNIPGVPGIGDKTAAQLLQEYGDLEGVLANIDKISGAKRKENLTNHAEDARISKQLATAITDIDIELDLDELMAKRMDRSRLREVAREFELRVILAAPGGGARGGFRPRRQGRGGARRHRPGGHRSTISPRGRSPWRSPARPGPATTARSLVEGDCPDFAELAKALGERRLIGHDLKSLGGGARYGVLAAAGPAASTSATTRWSAPTCSTPRAAPTTSSTSRPSAASRLRPKDAEGADGDQLELGEEPPPDPAAEARLVWEIAQLQRKGMKEQKIERLMDEVEMPLIEVLAAMEQTGVLLDQKRLADIGEGFEQRIETLQAEIFELAGHEFTIGSPQQLAEVLFDELGLTKKRRGKTGFSTDARVLSQIREEHEIVTKVEQWRELTKLKSTYLDALPELIDPDTRPPAHHLQPDRHRHRPPLEHQPEPPEHPDPHRGGPSDPLLLRRARAATACSPPTTTRSSCGSWLTSPARTPSERSSPAARTSTPPPPPRYSARTRRGSAPAIARRPRWSTTASPTASRPTASPTGSTSSRTRPRSYIDRYFERFPGGQALHRGDDRVRARRRATSRPCSAAAARSPSFAPAAPRSAARASASR